MYYEDSDSYKNCLENGETDIMLSTDVYIKEHYNVAAMIPAEAYYLIIAKDESKLCQEMSEAMEAIYAANPNFATDLCNKYFPNSYRNSIVFTEEEKAFVENADPIRVAVIENRYPQYYEEDGVAAGKYYSKL